MSKYLLINILIIAGPLILSFENKISFRNKISSVLKSVAVVSTIFIIWDVSAVLLGDWSFNKAYISGISILYLPYEEILFFITVPYGCLFIYEVTKHFVKDNGLRVNKFWNLFFTALFVSAAVIYHKQQYTFTVLVFCAVFVSTASFLLPSLLGSRVFWITVLISFIPFGIVNYFLTSLPVVRYNPNAIWGLRVTTIPVEDFFYSFSMVSFYILFYILAEEKYRMKRLIFNEE